MIEQQRVAHQAELERQEKKIIELEKEQLEADLRFKSKRIVQRGNDEYRSSGVF